MPERVGDTAESLGHTTENLGSSCIGNLVSDDNVGSKGAIAEAKKTRLTCFYRRLRSVKAVVARDNTLVLVCCELFE